MDKYKGEVGLIFVTVVWGLGFPITEIALRYATPYQLMAVRFTIAAVLLLIIFHKKTLRISGQNIKYGVIIGLFLFSGFMLQTIGLQFTPPSKSAFLTTTNVVMVPLIGLFFFKQKVDRYGMAGAVLALLGVAVLSLNVDLSVNKGDILSLMCAACFAGHVYFTGEFLSRGSDVIGLTIVQMVTASICSVCLLLIVGGNSVLSIGKTGLLAGVYLGVVSTTIAFLIQTASQRHLSQTKTVVILSMESVFGTLFSVLILQEAVGFRTFLGSIIILGGVLVSETGALAFANIRTRFKARRV